MVPNRWARVQNVLQRPIWSFSRVRLMSKDGSRTESALWLETRYFDATARRAERCLPARPLGRDFRRPPANNALQHAAVGKFTFAAKVTSKTDLGASAHTLAGSRTGWLAGAFPQHCVPSKDTEMIFFVARSPLRRWRSDKAARKTTAMPKAWYADRPQPHADAALTTSARRVIADRP